MLGCAGQMAGFLRVDGVIREALAERTDDKVFGGLVRPGHQILLAFVLDLQLALGHCQQDLAGIQNDLFEIESPFNFF